MLPSARGWAVEEADLDWLGRKRIRLYAGAILVLYLLLAGLDAHRSIREARPRDFVQFPAAARLVLQGRPEAAYDRQALRDEEIRVLGSEVHYIPWSYPPTFLPFVLPLADLGYLPGLALWLVVGTALYLAAIRGLWDDPLLPWIALAFPGFWTTVFHGQNGLLATAFLGYAVARLPDRPVRAGVAFALLAFKPQLATMVPIALLAGGYRTCLVATAASWSALAGATLLAWGPAPWHAFLDQASRMAGWLTLGDPVYAWMPTGFAAIRLLGGSVAMARIVQGAISVLALLLVVRAFRSPVDQDLRTAALGLSLPLSTPYAFGYDLTILTVPLVALLRLGSRDGFAPGEKPLLVLAWCLPLAAPVAGSRLGIPLAPVVLLALAQRVWRRLDRTGPGPGPGPE